MNYDEIHNIIKQVKLKKDGVWYTVLAYAAGYGWVIGDTRKDPLDGYDNLRIIGVGDIDVARTNLSQ